MAVSESTREVHPLRRVTVVDVSEEMGTALGNPHYFWMARRYTMTLECGHTEARVSSNFEQVKPEELMPKKVRCKECPPKRVPVRDKSNPKYDHVASALTAALLGAGKESERNEALDWVSKNGSWIDDDAERALVYGQVALGVFDVMMDGRTVKHSGLLRSDIEAWHREPSVTHRELVRRTSRRLYSAQHAQGNDWFAARALVCLGRVASMGKHSSSGIVEALTWDQQSREGFYERMWAARHAFDASTIVPSLRDGQQEAHDNMIRIWDEEYPQVGDHHVPLLLHLTDVYTRSRISSQSTR